MALDRLLDPKPPDKEIMDNEMGDASAELQNASSNVEDSQTTGAKSPNLPDLSP